MLLLLLLGCVPVAQAQVTRTQDLRVQYYRAETAWKSGASVLEVKARVDRVLKELPDDVEALKLRTRALLHMGRDAEALVDAQRAVALHPTDGEAQLLLSEAARRNGDVLLAERTRTSP